MANLNVYNVLGEKISKIDVDSKVFDIEPHNQAMFDQVLSERASLRQGTSKVKTRTEVSGGGRKPWKQKGTGRARQGSIRSPQWRGGGVVFGPTGNRNYEIKLNKKVVKLAFKSGWSLTNQKKSIFVLDKIDFKTPSTKDFIKLLENFKLTDKKVLLVLSDGQKEINTLLSSRNLDNVLPVWNEEVMLDDILNSDAIILTTETIKSIEGGLN